LIPVVVDASVAAKWFVEDVLSRQANAALAQCIFFAPGLIQAETANTLWKYARRGDLQAADCREALWRLPHVVKLTPDSELAADAAVLSVELDHPAYDCFYIALARRLGHPILTADQRLARKVDDMIDVRSTPLATIPLEDETS